MRIGELSGNFGKLTHVREFWTELNVAIMCKHDSKIRLTLKFTSFEII